MKIPVHRDTQPNQPNHHKARPYIIIAISLILAALIGLAACHIFTDPSIPTMASTDDSSDLDDSTDSNDSADSDESDNSDNPAESPNNAGKDVPSDQQFNNPDLNSPEQAGQINNSFPSEGTSSTDISDPESSKALFQPKKALSQSEGSSSETESALSNSSSEIESALSKEEEPSSSSKEEPLTQDLLPDKLPDKPSDQSQDTPSNKDTSSDRAASTASTQPTTSSTPSTGSSSAAGQGTPAASQPVNNGTGGPPKNPDGSYNWKANWKNPVTGVINDVNGNGVPDTIEFAPKSVVKSHKLDGSKLQGYDSNGNPVDK